MFEVYSFRLSFCLPEKNNLNILQSIFIVFADQLCSVQNFNPSNDLHCIAILPGIGCYGDSSGSDTSSDEQSSVDLCGRPVLNGNDQ